MIFVYLYKNYLFIIFILMENITNDINDNFLNSFTPEEILQMNDDQLVYNVFWSVYTKIDEIIEKYPKKIEVIKNFSNTKDLIKYNNFSEKIAYSYTLAQLILIIIITYKFINKKDKKEDENDDENYYEDYELIEVDDIPLL